MLDSALWGLVQGLTEFLPISSSGHLVLVPAFLDKEAPDLATTAVLHLGTLAAVIWYFRRDVTWLIRPETPPAGVEFDEIATGLAATFQSPGEPILDAVDLSGLVVAEVMPTIRNPAFSPEKKPTR